MTTEKIDMPDRIEKWITAGRNPGIAYWHGALEDAMASFAPYLQTGRLMPVHALADGDEAAFSEVYALLDLCPVIQAAFVPAAMGGVLTPPAAVDSLRRVHKDNKSRMLLCRRPGLHSRILCAEISKDAWKPGVDIFEEGALLGTYEFDSGVDCIRELSKLVRIHLWLKEKWTVDQYTDYTLNWFTRVADTGRTDVPVQPDFSYIHNPVLLNLTDVEAVFKLIQAVTARQFQESLDSQQTNDHTSILWSTDPEERHRFLEGHIVGLLNLLGDSKVVEFASFTSRENERFKDSFAQTVKNLDGFLGKSLQKQPEA